jgi:hypothetical protein
LKICKIAKTIEKKTGKNFAKKKCEKIIKKSEQFFGGIIFWGNNILGNNTIPFLYFNLRNNTFPFLYFIKLLPENIYFRFSMCADCKNFLIFKTGLIWFNLI